MPLSFKHHRSPQAVWKAGIFLAVFCGLLVPAAWAFHERGTANCNGCHTMHNSENGLPMDPSAPSGEPWMLLAPSATDVCLSCHASANGAVWGRNPLSPPPEMGAGNFVFLQEDNVNDASNGATSPIPGRACGHNVTSVIMHGMYDPMYSTSPGGSYPVWSLGCTSCHDPHGNDNFRLLYGTGPVKAGNFFFNYPAPKAIGISVLSGSEGLTNHTAYQSGMSAWCGNCHGTYHSAQSVSLFKHPADLPLGPEIAQQYGFYNGSAAPRTGNSATSYLPQVPFEDPAMTVSGQSGPSASSAVMCLSCHRAHASSAPEAGRWDFDVVTLGQDGLQSGSFPIPNPYADPAQKSLCCKCHVNGEDHGQGQTCLSCHGVPTQKSNSRVTTPSILH
jgi:predicted CXXCH cytochrome family protein